MREKQCHKGPEKKVNNLLVLLYLKQILLKFTLCVTYKYNFVGIHATGSCSQANVNYYMNGFTK